MYMKFHPIKKTGHEFKFKSAWYHQLHIQFQPHRIRLISQQTYHMVLDGDIGDLLSQVTAGNSGLNRS